MTTLAVAVVRRRRNARRRRRLGSALQAALVGVRAGCRRARCRDRRTSRRRQAAVAEDPVGVVAGRVEIVGLGRPSSRRARRGSSRTATGTGTGPQPHASGVGGANFVFGRLEPGPAEEGPRACARRTRRPDRTHSKVVGRLDRAAEDRLRRVAAVRLRVALVEVPHEEVHRRCVGHRLAVGRRRRPRRGRVRVRAVVPEAVDLEGPLHSAVGARRGVHVGDQVVVGVVRVGADADERDRGPDRLLGPEVGERNGRRRIGGQELPQAAVGVADVEAGQDGDGRVNALERLVGLRVEAGRVGDDARSGTTSRLRAPTSTAAITSPDSASSV